MKKGYDVFGKAYGVMLRNDLHNIHSIDHKLLQEMILLEPDSYRLLYSAKPTCPDMRSHELWGFAQSFRGQEDLNSIRNLLAFTSNMAENFSLPLEEMRFGGTEKEILHRGTDWCADMARAAAALLMCLGIPARILHLANTEKAYYGHVIVEAFYEGKYGVIDPIYGYLFYDGAPLDAFTLLTEPERLKAYDEEYRGLFRSIAVSEYDPMNAANDYSVSNVNDYYRTLLTTNHNGSWLMGEDQSQAHVTGSLGDTSVPSRR